MESNIDLSAFTNKFTSRKEMYDKLRTDQQTLNG